ncbi:unnamed protein product, partial [Rotaria socialis]
INILVTRTMAQEPSVNMAARAMAQEPSVNMATRAMAQEPSVNIFLEISETTRQTNYPQFNFPLNCVFERRQYSDE